MTVAGPKRIYSEIGILLLMKVFLTCYKPTVGKCLLILVVTTIMRRNRRT